MPGEGLYTNPPRGLPQAQNRGIGGGNTSAIAQLLASARNRGGGQGRGKLPGGGGRGNVNANAIAQLLARARNRGGQGQTSRGVQPQSASLSGGLGARRGQSPQIQQLLGRLRGARG